VLAEFFASSFSLATVVILGLLIIDFAFLRNPYRRPGRFVGKFRREYARAIRRSRSTVRDAEAALVHFAIPRPQRWSYVQLIRWHLAERGQWRLSLLVTVMVMTPLVASVILSIPSRHQDEWIRWTVGPSWILLWFAFLHLKLDRIATKRGCSMEYLYFAALRVLAAGARHGRKPDTATTGALAQSVENLRSGIIAYAQFGLPRYTGRDEVITHAFAIANKFSKDLNEVLRDRTKTAALIERVLKLLTAVTRQEPLRMLTDVEAASVSEDPVEKVDIPWRMLGIHLLALLIGGSLLLGLKWIGLGAEYLAFAPLAGVVYLAVKSPYALVGGAPAELREMANLGNSEVNEVPSERPVGGSRA
jgi:hypothetical protein